MERLWADLSADEKDLPSPEWHGTVIAERLKAVEEGPTRYGDWDEARHACGGNCREEQAGHRERAGDQP